MTRSENSKPTKELILDAAFSFLEQPRYTSFSMNELAEKVGITKPAIYRHFKNKEAVLAAMEGRVFGGMMPFLRALVPSQSSINRSSLISLVEHLIENPTHINYLIAQMSSTPNYEEYMFNLLYESDVAFVQEGGKNGYLEHFNSDMNLFSRHVFSGMSIFYFVKLIEKLKCDGSVESFPKNYAEKIVDLMMNGLSGMTKEGDYLHPAAISEERKQELINLCKINEEVFPKENRIFTALANVIEKYKMTGVTVERIAAELNMAKSSLYEYFDNKNEMVKSLIFKELALLQTIVVENSTEAENFTEYAYILMLSEMEYFSHRPSIIPICGWLLMGGVDMPEDGENCEKENGRSPWEKRLPEKVNSPDLGFEYSPEIITGWIKCLPISFLVEAKGKDISKEKRMEGFMLTINYILNGIEKSGGNK